MPLIHQIYCQQNNTCSSIPLEKRKVIKKTLTRTFGLLLVIFFVCMVVAPSIISTIGSFFLYPERMNNTYGSIQSPTNMSILLSLFGFLFLFIGIVIFILLLVYIYQCYYYRYYFYDLRQEDIVIKKGVISRGEITLPYSKIQNVFVDQDFWDRIFRIYDVHIETAGLGSGMAAHIDGVNYQNSEKLRDMIMAKVKSQGGSDKSV